MKRIGAGGIAIESCTFSPLPSTLADFLVLRGDAQFERYPFLRRSREDLLWLPTLQAKAIPGGPVVRADYESLKREFLERVERLLPLHGFFLDLHGAMNVQGLDDAERDLAADLRRLVGPRCLISASMDLHGNVSPDFVRLVDIITAYRTAPHEDVIETREKACRLLVRALDEDLRPCRAWARIPVLLAGERTSTFVEPGRGVYAALAESDGAPGLLDASLFAGYAWADEPRTGAAAVVTALDPAVARVEVVKIARRFWKARREFDFIAPAGSADWCIAQAVQTEGSAVFISDSGDNPTAGGAGDTPYFVGRLLAREEFRGGSLTAIFASIPDPAAVEACGRAGAGRTVELSLGGKLDPRVEPLRLRATVHSLHPADPVGGDLAVVKAGGVHIILTSRRKPFHVIREFTRLSLDPAAHKVTAVKIGYLEPELRAAARRALLALTPGAVNQDIPSLPYLRVRRPMFPLDDAMHIDECELAVFEQ